MAKQQSILPKIGSWAFIIGIVIALILGIFQQNAPNPIVVSILIVLGIIVGFLNVTGHETTPFLLATVSLVIVTSFGGSILSAVNVIGPYLQGILGAMMTFVIPSTIVVALKAIWALAADE